MILHKHAVGPFQMNCYILGCEDTKEGVIIDPGDEVDLLLKTVEEENLQLKAILNTHAHFDHIAGVAEIKKKTGLPFYLHEGDLFWIEGIKKQAEVFGLSIPEKPEVDHYLNEGDRFPFGKYSLKVIHTPGHSPGGVTFVLNEGVTGESAPRAFVGDCLFAGSIGRTDFPGGSHPELIQAIKTKILPLGDETIIHSGHGPDTTVYEERLHNPFLQ
jgi:glyoxylase-like metal-dependent hydrolase (beta-lactamase superfamily II)